VTNGLLLINNLLGVTAYFYVRKRKRKTAEQPA
jgi:hypothetical protein